jgi:hypothetical protein
LTPEQKDCPTTRQSLRSFWSNEKWLCPTTLCIRQI